MNQTHAQVCYVYGFVRTIHDGEGVLDMAGKLRDTLLGQGFDGNVPHVLLGYHGISAIVCTAECGNFADADYDSRMTSLANVAQRMVRHQQVLENAMVMGPLMPLHFGTVFKSEEELHAFLDTHSGAILDFLTKIEGRREWSVQGYVDMPLCGGLLAESKPYIERPRGVLPQVAELLRDELRKQHLREIVADWAEAKCGALFKALTPMAADSSERRLLLRDGGADSCEMVANWAFLLDDSVADTFRSYVEQASRDMEAMGLSFHLTGPWPPFSFTPDIAPEITGW